MINVVILAVVQLPASPGIVIQAVVVHVVKAAIVVAMMVVVMNVVVALKGQKTR